MGIPGIIPEHLRLYGLAVAAIPRKDDPKIIDVTCTPISVDRANRESFDVLNDLVLKTSFNSTDTKQVMDGFCEVVGLLEKIVNLQTQSLEQHGLPYRPVSVIVGQAGKSPTNHNALYMQLFGERFSPPRSRKDILDDFVYEWHGRFPNMDERTIRWVVDGVALDSAVMAEAAKDAVATEAAKLRAAFLVGKKTAPKKFMESCKKLAGLLNKCSLRDGSFTEIGVFDLKHVEANEEDAKIIELQKKLKEQHDPDAYYALKDLAEQKGKEFGLEATENIHIFQHAAPYGYRGNKKAQADFPRFSFFHDDPDFIAAFQKGFQEAYLGPHTRRMKLPLDPPQPFFTDPCADMVRDQHEIIDGRRWEEGCLDLKDVRQKIIDSAQKVAKLPAGIEITPRSEEWANGAKVGDNASSKATEIISR